VVEDHESVLEITARMLADAGFKVMTASHGVEALEILKNQPEVDLLITDIRMPLMGGAELSRKVLERRPDLPIIYISGYPADWNPETAAGRRQAFLRKPFTMDDLVRAIKTLLEH
jgi:two-component system cell cycle sensor histidine kinase/response regulator CckA